MLLNGFQVFFQVALTSELTVMGEFTCHLIVASVIPALTITNFQTKELEGIFNAEKMSYETKGQSVKSF